MIWNEIEYSVTDTPTRLEDEQYFVTHPLPILPGWRFQAKSSAGDNQIFDVRLDTIHGQWLLTRIYL